MGQRYRHGPGRVCGYSVRGSRRPRVMALVGHICPGCHRRSRAAHRCTRRRLHPQPASSPGLLGGLGGAVADWRGWGNRPSAGSHRCCPAHRLTTSSRRTGSKGPGASCAARTTTRIQAATGRSGNTSWETRPRLRCFRHPGLWASGKRRACSVGPDTCASHRL